MRQANARALETPEETQRRREHDKNRAIKLRQNATQQQAHDQEKDRTRKGKQLQHSTNPERTADDPVMQTPLDFHPCPGPQTPQFVSGGQKFHEYLGHRKFIPCDHCNQLNFVPIANNETNFTCADCCKDRGEPKRFSAENDMDPGAQPDALKNLSHVEQLLIAQAIPMMTVVRLPRGGQYSYKGNVISFPQDITEFVTSLPRRIDELDFLIVRHTSDARNSQHQRTHRDFRVRRNAVLRALLYLKQNNIYYKDIHINDENLHALPEDMCVEMPNLESSAINSHDQSAAVSTEKSRTASRTNNDATENESNDTAAAGRAGVARQPAIPDPKENEPTTPAKTQDRSPASSGNVSPETMSLDEALNVVEEAYTNDYDMEFDAFDAEALAQINEAEREADDIIPGAFVPVNLARPSEAAAVERVIDWPKVVDKPINEYEDAGFISRCYPTLFPTGAADLHSSSPNRRRALKEAEYFRHLMLYKDQRFSQHVTFRYFALNMLMRHRANATGRVYVRQHQNDEVFENISALRNTSAEVKQSLAQKIVRFASHLRTSPAFWKSERAKVIALIDQFGMPTAFFTLSAADTQWSELQTHLANFSDASDNPVKAVAKNPLLCTWFFHHRVKAFIEHFLTSELGITDYWWRYEWQSRGSVHCHGILYLKDAIDRSELATTMESFKKDLADYIDKLVTAMHPGTPPQPGQPFVPPVRHPCKVPFDAVEDWDIDYESLINCVERHTVCSRHYCLGKKRGSTEAECRFGFPKELTSETTVTVKRDDRGSRTSVTAEPRRNDPLLNTHNRSILQTWRANVDFQLIFDHHRVVEYVAKYMTKSETASSNLSDLFSAVLHTADETSERAVISSVQRLLIKASCERDISAQEVTHHLLELPMTQCSRQFRVLAIDGKEDIDTIEREVPTEHTGRERPHLVDVYVERDPARDSLSLFEYTKKHFRRSRNGIRKDVTYQREMVVRVIPRLVACPTDKERHLQYCRQQLVLHKPFRKLTDLVDGYANAIDAFTDWVASAAAARHSETALADDVANFVDEFEREMAQDEEMQLDPDDEWLMLLRVNPAANADERDILRDLPDYPGFDWNHSANNLDVRAGCDFINIQRESSTDVADIVQVLPETLQGRQRDAFNIIAAHAAREDNPIPVLALFCGSAGSGKSYLIHALRTHLGSRCRVVAPTGVAAFGIGGTTAHHAFHLPVQKTAQFTDLQSGSVKSLQEEHNKGVGTVLYT